MVDFDEVKKRQQATWASGDFARIGTVTVLVGETLCESVRLHALESVLDVATGSGNTALAAARRRCVVTGVDYVPALLARARLCAEAEQLPVDFREGDAERLPFPDRNFDCALSTFGSMFAPDQEKAAAELLRVCRDGGRVGLACWTPESWAGSLFKTVSKRAPPPPGLKPPTRWGTDAGIRELFGGTARIESQRRVANIRGETPEAFVAHFRRYFGPVVKAFEVLDPAAQAELERELIALTTQFNRSGDDTVLMESEYLESVIHKP
ncbi:MAG: class I SAM-dependent methyltransferase [Thermoplasmata archaeon]